MPFQSTVSIQNDIDQGQTFGLYSTFAHKTKLRAITLHRDVSPEVSNLSFDVSQRHCAVAASVLCYL